MAFFADTNLCSKVPKDISLQDRWAQAKERFGSEGHPYVICPLVLIELLVGLAKPEPAYFRSDLQRLVFLAGEGPPQYLRFPGAFVLKSVLECESPAARLGQADFREWHRAVLSAESRDDLVNGRVDLYNSRLLSVGLDLISVKRQQDEVHSAYVEEWEGRRRDRQRMPSQLEHAALFLYSQGIIYQTEDLQKVADGIDAQYRYDLAVYRVMQNYNFRADRNHGDAIDRQLPYYLSDPTMHLVTGDARFKQRVAGSTQENRVHLITDF